MPASSIPMHKKHAVVALCLAAASAFSQASPPPAAAPDIRVDVDLVRLSCSATEHGVPVKGLQKDDFLIREDSILQEVKYFWQESELPLTIGLIVDVSGSQTGLVNKHRETVAHFLKQVLRPEDRAMLVTVGPQAHLLTDLTGSIDDLSASIDHITQGRGDAPILGEPCRGDRARLRARGRHRYPCGGTALWNAVYFASRLKMRGVSGRKALLVLSDGLDTGSDHRLEDAIEAAQAAETAVYTIKFVSPIEVMFLPVIAAQHGMRKMSEETGGVAYGIMHGNLGEVFQQIDTELRNQYVLAYTSTNRARDGAFRKVEISSKRSGVQVRTRKGYPAPRDSP
jgi:VWFA-related protein